MPDVWAGVMDKAIVGAAVGGTMAVIYLAVTIPFNAIRKRRAAAKTIDNQRQWIKDHGGDVAGYVKRYGGNDDPRRIGKGGEALYAEDVARLQELEERETMATNSRASASDAVAHNWFSRQTIPALFLLAFLGGALAATLFWWQANSYEECVLSEGRGQPLHMLHVVKTACLKRFPKDAQAGGPWEKYQTKTSATSRSTTPPIPEGYRLVDPGKAAP